MTKATLIDRIMIKFGYDRLDAERQANVRKAYGRMTKDTLERLVA